MITCKCNRAYDNMQISKNIFLEIIVIVITMYLLCHPAKYFFLMSKVSISCTSDDFSDTDEVVVEVTSDIAQNIFLQLRGILEVEFLSGTNFAENNLQSITMQVSKDKSQIIRDNIFAWYVERIAHANPILQN